MGDRGNIFIQEGQVGEDRIGVWLYSHWSGYMLPLALQRAMRRGKERLDDPQYFARIVFDEMTKEHHGELTGFGISARIGDNEHPLLVVNHVKDRIEAHHYSRTTDGPPLKNPPLKMWSFEEYMAIEWPDGADPWTALLGEVR